MFKLIFFVCASRDTIEANDLELVLDFNELPKSFSFLLLFLFLLLFTFSLLIKFAIDSDTTDIELSTLV